MRKFREKRTNNMNELANIMREFKRYGDINKVLNLIGIDNIYVILQNN